METFTLSDLGVFLGVVGGIITSIADLQSRDECCATCPLRPSERTLHPQVIVSARVSRDRGDATDASQKCERVHRLSRPRSAKNRSKTEVV